MVERIVDAGRLVLVEEGYERATTNRVASRAGISPGSLYQYFPNKEAICSAVVERYSADVGEQLTAVLSDRMGLPPDQIVRGSYEGLLTVLESHREYVRLVTQVLPPSGIAGHVAQVETRVGELVGAYLTVSRTPTPLPVAQTAWILVRMVEHLCVQYVLEQPAIERSVFVDQLVRLTAAHLRVTPDVSNPSPSQRDTGHPDTVG